MNVTIRSSDIEELAEYPELARRTRTPTVLSGTGLFVMSISMLDEILAKPDAGQQLVEAQQEQEYALDMAILDTDDTGIENTCSLSRYRRICGPRSQSRD